MSTSCMVAACPRPPAARRGTAGSTCIGITWRFRSGARAARWISGTGSGQSPAPTSSMKRLPGTIPNPLRDGQGASWPGRWRMALYGIVSDIHGNLEALSAAAAFLADRGATRILCLGDLVRYNADPDACVSAVLDVT